jgi:vacuolar-type H+-ATPase subunit I/STV1
MNKLTEMGIFVIDTERKTPPCEAHLLDQDDADGLLQLKSVLNGLKGDEESGDFARKANNAVAKILSNVELAWDDIEEKIKRIAELEEEVRVLNQRCDALELVAKESK